MNLGNGAAWWLSLVVVSLLSPPEASACSPYVDAGVPACVTRSWSSLPAAGDVGVPTNVRFSLSFAWPATDPERAPIVRRASDGASVALARAATGMFAADVDLDPGTEYLMYDVGDPASCGETDPDVEIEVARFTTGTGPDLVPPAPPVVRGTSEC